MFVCSLTITSFSGIAKIMHSSAVRDDMIFSYDNLRARLKKSDHLCLTEMKEKLIKDDPPLEQLWEIFMS